MVSDITYQLATDGPGPGLSKSVDISTDRNLPPHALHGLFWETLWMHHQYSIGCEPIHLTIWVLPLCCFFLQGEIDI